MSANPFSPLLTQNQSNLTSSTGCYGQGEAVGLVADGQLQRRIDVAVLLVAAHVDVALARPPVGESVDQPRVSVEGKDHRLVWREDGLEIAVRHAVRMFNAGQQF